MILREEYFILYDLIAIVIAVLLLMHAYRKGLMAQIFGVVAWIISFVAAWLMYDGLSASFSIVELPLFDDAFNQLLWFFLCFTACRLICAFIRGFVFGGKKKKTALSFLNHVGGLLIGFIEVCIIIQCWFSFCQLPFVENGETYIQQSLLTKGRQVIEEELRQL